MQAGITSLGEAVVVVGALRKCSLPIAVASWPASLTRRCQLGTLPS